MTQSSIQITNARKNNLKIDYLEIPTNKLVVITGPSGSGKSSLALGTLYAEGQGRYVKSLSSYARQFLSVLDEPKVESIEGLSPAIAIEQKSGSHNPRSTVGTITEIYDYIRLLYARIGTPYCPEHNIALKAMSVAQIVDHLINKSDTKKIVLMAPLIEQQSGAHQALIDKLSQEGYVRVRLNGIITRLNELEIDPKKKNTLELVIDRLKVTPDNHERLADSLEQTSIKGQGRILVLEESNSTADIYSTEHACVKCGWSIGKLEPKLFSFNSPMGACSTCDGLGMRRFIKPENLVINPLLSLNDGVIRFWEPAHKHYFAILSSVCDHFEIDMNTPWKNLPEEHKHVVLYGTPKRIALSYPNIYGKLVVKRRVFDGIIPNLEKRYEQTETASVKESIGKILTYDFCQSCNGSRLNQAARHVLVCNQAIDTTINLPIDQLHHWVKNLKLSNFEKEVAGKILVEIENRCQFLLSVGLNYLFLNRSAETLSGGESQRIRLASQIGSGLVGVMYVLDEPSIGLHMRDNQRLIDTLLHLKNLGNTVIVVEHDEETMLQADMIYDIGPGAGTHGGNVTAYGHSSALMQNKDSLTGAYLAKKRQVPIPPQRIPASNNWIEVIGASCHNLQSVHLKIPIGLITCVTGVSGSGKSSLINNTLYPNLYNTLNKAHMPAGKCTQLLGHEHIDKIIDIDQSPIGRTPRSNPATYTGIFTHIRDLFSQTEAARSRGYQPGRFSFNVKGGRCDACSGDGLIKVEMHFLSDVYVQCNVCKGSRFNRETLEVTFKNKSIAEVLDLTVEEAIDIFQNIPSISKKLQTLKDVGLGYIKLGQSATTLSGGEAQRIKLARELSKRSTGKTLFILDEPTTGLHFHDIVKLMQVIQTLRAHGNTIIIIEHNIDVIKTADWIVDIGPEGGNGGGAIVAEGTPEQVMKHPTSHTAPYLLEALSQ
ncbi:excinuclease ABC subunit UvrA [Candidatus Comchoanobacter bicostacola]|uniref:UvrABC system protein A n=1 Tax=Candidatus Comchoanobacter bicostacola TaxID=2919598 RepID=A0ABY5DKN6_9GAMM|nr:excinuclease ABC subunit UvrA [Candidatus Comchoanobacter bicostacola]UTC24386.1 excinuclease ABC subunit UvrA [Candidatus Comchoanobacter bicostacola]